MLSSDISKLRDIIQKCKSELPLDALLKIAQLEKYLDELEDLDIKKAEDSLYTKLHTKILDWEKEFSDLLGHENVS